MEWIYTGNSNGLGGRQTIGTKTGHAFMDGGSESKPMHANMGTHVRQEGVYE